MHLGRRRAHRCDANRTRAARDRPPCTQGRAARHRRRSRLALAVLDGYHANYIGDDEEEEEMADADDDDDEDTELDEYVLLHSFWTVSQFSAQGLSVHLPCSLWPCEREDRAAGSESVTRMIPRDGAVCKKVGAGVRDLGGSRRTYLNFASRPFHGVPAQRAGDFGRRRGVSCIYAWMGATGGEGVRSRAEHKGERGRVRASGGEIRSLAGCGKQCGVQGHCRRNSVLRRFKMNGGTMVEEEIHLPQQSRRVNITELTDIRQLSIFQSKTPGATTKPARCPVPRFALPRRAKKTGASMVCIISKSDDARRCHVPSRLPTPVPPAACEFFFGATGVHGLRYHGRSSRAAQHVSNDPFEAERTRYLGSLRPLDTPLRLLPRLLVPSQPIEASWSSLYRPARRRDFFPTP
ncbi:hypothetical protein B0H11DRAFT_1940308 [Mycena galericulata]|nr:hypothetical protein B0H11DRAFT_1940308 [Mycena galericulata]